MMNLKVRKCPAHHKPSVVNREKPCQPKNGDILRPDAAKTPPGEQIARVYFSNYFTLCYLEEFRNAPMREQAGALERFRGGKAVQY
jgi:hypothetical protein